MLAIIASILVVAFGLVILWSNPSRLVNRLVGTSSFHVGAWLLCLNAAFVATDGLAWLRLACAVAASIPLHLWVIQRSIAGSSTDRPWHYDLRLFSWRIAVVTVLTALPFTDLFIPAHSTSAVRMFGWGYYAYLTVFFALCALLLVDTFRATKNLVGSQRLESQVWLMGGGAATLLILGLMGLNALTHDHRLIRVQPLVVLLFYAGTVIAITTHRIFDARQIFTVLAEKTLLILIVAGAAFGIDYALGAILPTPVDFFVTTALSLWLAGFLSGWLNGLFHSYPQATNARRAAFAAAAKESEPLKLEQAFLAILKGWGQSDRALIMTGSRGRYEGGGVELAVDCPFIKLIKEIHWATPERLARERPTPERDALAAFLAAQNLGVVVSCEGPGMDSLVGVGVAASRRPFTYPQVTQLLELGAIIESALERAHFSAKAQHAEQLATVGVLGASLAHEIRNPLVSIKTFVQLLPKHYQDAAFREKFFGLIGDEVTRIDRLTEQLLDMASPRVYSAQMVELHPVLQSSLELVVAKAAGKQIKFLTDFQAKPDLVYTDPSAAKQVMLNLCFNAIHAVEHCEGEKWVKVSTRRTVGGFEMIVADSGPGIAPDIRPRLFQPFQTTKSSGFGLGLAICSDILGKLNATICVDPAAPNKGAVFRVTLPCQPSLS